jgi:hydrogenase/urease accessory protein HupE
MGLAPRDTRPYSVAAIAALVSTISSPAHAHLVATGSGPFFDGLFHSLVSIDGMLAAAGVAVLAGLSGKAGARAAVIVYPLAWLAGAVFGIRFGGAPLQPWLSIASFLGLGLAIAAKIRLAPPAVGALAFLVALAFGPTMTFDLPVLSSTTLFLLGSVSAMSVALVVISAAALSLSDGWTLIAVRALGSWLAAAGLLLLGWALRG